MGFFKHLLLIPFALGVFNTTSAFFFRHLATSALSPAARQVVSQSSSSSVINPKKATNLLMKAAKTESSEDTLYKNIYVTGNNIEVTPAMKDYVLKKIGKVLAKLHPDDILKVDVHLSVVVVAHHAKHSHTAEATVFMKGGQVLRASETTDYLYASVDIISHSLTRLLRKYKDRKLAQRKDKNFRDEAESELEALGEFGSGSDGSDFEDPANSIDMKIVKTKQFDMPPMSVKDAIVCLSFISHPFYVFRNEATNEINVVYKRKMGGVGVIEPRE